MNAVQKMRMEIAESVLCCFTCWYSTPIEGTTNLQCSLVESKPKKVKDDGICKNWYPDISVDGQANWEDLLEALKERRKASPNCKS